MADITISGPMAQGLDGVAFTAMRDGVAHSCMVSREVLEDAEYNMYETPQAMLEAFDRLRQRVAEEAARALDAGATGTVRIETLVI